MSARETLNRLTRLQCEHARMGETLNDGGGLYLEMGKRLWRFRYKTECQRTAADQAAQPHLAR